MRRAPNTAVIARLDRAIQYAAAYRSIAEASGILDHPPSRVMTTRRIDAFCNGGHASLLPSLFELRRDKLPTPHESASGSALACAGGAGIGNFSNCFGKFTGR